MIGEMPEQIEGYSTVRGQDREIKRLGRLMRLRIRTVPGRGRCPIDSNEAIG